MQLPFTISETDLVRAFDPMTLTRGTRYAGERRVRNLRVDSSGTEIVLTAEVQGNSRRAYVTHVFIGDKSLESDCTCPVGWRCKHAVAIVQSVRRLASVRPVQVTPPWQRTLDQVLGGFETVGPSSGKRRKLALEIDLAPQFRTRWAPASAPRHLLEMRPLREGARGNWIKTGISWTQAAAAHHDTEHDTEQMQVLASFSRALRGTTAGDVVALHAFGPQLHHLLLDADAAGIPLVCGPSVSTVEVLSEALDLAVDATRGDTSGLLRLGVWHEEQFHTGDRMHLLGRPPHSVALLRADETTTRPFGGAKTAVRLAPLRRRAPESLLSLHEQGGEIEVPAGDSSRLVDDYLPRLRQGIEVTSSDGSITLPEEVPPRLQMLLAWQGVRATTTWQWRYGEHTHLLDDPDPAPAVRRSVLEQELLTATERYAHLQPRAELTPMESLRFAEDELPRLWADDDVEVVETGTRPDFRAAEGDPQIEFVAGEGTTDWLDLSVVITVDGEQVPLPQALAALTAGDPLLLLPSGLHVPTDRPEFAGLAELVAAAAELHEGERDELRVAHVDLGLWEQLAELGVVDVQAARWVEAAQALAHHQGLPDVVPTGLVSSPRDYQLKGIRWLVHLWQLGLGGILADDMGLGKTLQTLGLISHARAAGAAPFLVVAPTSVVTAWAGEAQRHTPGLVIRTIDASRARRGTPLSDEVVGADVVVTSYTLLRLEADAYAALEWGGLVLDEAQTIKNHQSKTYQAVRLLDVPFRLAVTGTPFENRLMELWALLSVVAPGLYPWPKRFKEIVVKPVEKAGDPVALERFRSRVRPFVLRRTKDLVATELPPKQEQVLEVTLTPAHRRIYDTWLQKERQAILGLVDDFDRNRVAIFSALTRLRQLSLDPALVDDDHEGVGSAKIDTLVDHLQEIVAEGHRALVFSTFTGFLKRVRDALERDGVTTRYLDGSTRARGAEIAAFKDGDADAFLISLKAGGVGLTLTEADYVFVLDPWWNPAAEAQAVDRAHRLGQERPVLVYRLVATDTIEEKVMALKERKAALFASVFSGEGAVGSGIDADDVLALFD
ncbi:DEAD/DEAH box helicase [Nocardioides alcanivorans]|uniref:DEAD/DEAH box helicase n=1 Tax=Nocardioides alcanivorans TaxID=2897352 RepID=UPI001F233B4D|nr:DEAD/DEAH box helicase [Nocardioides alcanivorans]